jgi:hypothetical protein
MSVVPRAPIVTVTVPFAARLAASSSVGAGVGVGMVAAPLSEVGWLPAGIREQAVKGG